MTAEDNAFDDIEYSPLPETSREEPPNDTACVVAEEGAPEVTAPTKARADIPDPRTFSEIPQPDTPQPGTHMQTFPRRPQTTREVGETASKGSLLRPPESEPSFTEIDTEENNSPPAADPTDTPSPLELHKVPARAGALAGEHIAADAPEPDHTPPDEPPSPEEQADDVPPKEAADTQPAQTAQTKSPLPPNETVERPKEREPDLSSPQTEQSTENEKPPEEKSTLFIAYNKHTERAGRTIGQRMRNCKVVAIEAPFIKDEQTRRDIEAVYTFYVADDAKRQTLPVPTAEQTAQARRYIHNSFVTEDVLEGLKGKNADISLLDINMDHGANDELQRLSSDEMLVKPTLNLEPNATLRTALLRAAAGLARTTRVRDEVMATQITALTKKYPGARIGVVVGKGHHGLSKALEAVAHIEAIGVHADGSITNDVEGERFEIGTISPIIHAVQRGETVTEDQINRALLEFQMGRFRQVIDSPYLEEEDRYVTRLTDSEVRERLEQLDQIKRQQLPLYERRRRVSAFTRHYLNVRRPGN
jgi:hypothetical protein